MSQSKGFDMKSMSTAQKILLGAGVLYIIDTFLQWNRVCFDIGIDIGVDNCAGVAGTHGIGTLNLLLAIALVAWEAMGMAGVDIKAPKALVSAGLAGALVIGYGGYMRWQEHQAGGGGMGMTPPPPSLPGAPCSAEDRLKRARPSGRALSRLRIRSDVGCRRVHEEVPLLRRGDPGRGDQVSLLRQPARSR